MPPRNQKPPRRVTRDPERTRRRILEAALTEFAAKGFAGARVDAIARRAGTNKRMLYHYFKDKKGLFKSALHEKIAQRVTISSTYPDDPGERVPAWFLATCADAEWVRLIGWESLDNPSDQVVDERSRRQIAMKFNAHIAKLQKTGVFESSLDPAFTLLAMMSLSIFPQAFPQMTRLIVGRPVRDLKFQCEYAVFLKQIMAGFRPALAMVKRTKAKKS